MFAYLYRNIYSSELTALQLPHRRKFLHKQPDHIIQPVFFELENLITTRIRKSN